ncbi:MAG: hypothetical protein FWC50_09625 [Planctomycetaceae bacterium]|nr:hypothetical protein [Planctomycetaceae bacterium]
MPNFNQSLLLQRLRSLFFGKGNEVSHTKPRDRRFVVENLEDRQLLSVTAVAGAEKLYEPAEPGYVAQNVSVDVIDTTSASLAAAIAKSGNTSENSVPDPVVHQTGWSKNSSREHQWPVIGMDTKVEGDSNRIGHEHRSSRWSLLH